MRKRPATWLCGVLILTLLSMVADVAVPAEAAGAGAAQEGNAAGRSIVVLSQNVNITLAQGTFDSGLQPFPSVETGEAAIRADVPLQLTGQLVDGNFTLLSYGGGSEAARRNHGVAGHGEEIHWWFAGVEQAPLPVCWRSPDDAGGTGINGTFFVRNWLPDPALVREAGSYEMLFRFAGTRVYYPGYGEFQIYPPKDLPLRVNVVFPTTTRVLEPSGRVDAGSTVTIRGEVRGSDGNLSDGGMLISSGGQTLGPPLPRGLYIDDVKVTVPGIPATVFSEGFEGPAAAWAHGGDGDDWEVGTPVGGPSPYEGSRCLGTNLDGSYSHLADEWTETPSIDLSGFPSDAGLSFAAWSDLNSGDRAEVRVWNGSVWSDGVRITVPSGEWRVVTLDLGGLTFRGSPLPATGTSDLRVRFRLKSETPSARVERGEFALEWMLPETAGPGPEYLTLKFVPGGPYAPSFAYLKVEVAARLHFVVPDGSPRIGPDRWAEVNARLLDEQGRPPAIPIGRSAGSPLRVFWDDGTGPLSEVESVTAVNVTGWFVAAHRVPAGQSLENASFLLRFEGNGNYQPAEMAVNCSFRGQPSLVLEETPAVLRGGTAAVEGRLLLGERPLSGEGVSLAIPFPPYCLNLTTDSAGEFRGDISVPAGWPDDLVPVEARCSAGNGRPPVSSSTSISVLRLLSVGFEGGLLEKGSTVETLLDGLTFRGLAGRVTDERGRPAAAAEVVIQAMRPGGNDILGRTTTDPTGYFSLPYHVDWTERAGWLDLSAMASLPPSPPARKEAAFRVVSGTILSLDGLPGLAPGEWTNVSGTLCEDRAGVRGEPVRDASVTVDFGGRKYDVLTDSSGRFRARCAVAQSVGSVSVIAAYGGAEGLRPSSVAASAEIAGLTPSASPSPAQGMRPAPAGTAVAAGSAFLAVIAAALIGGTEAGRFKMLLALVPLYSKIRKEEVLDQFVRGQVFGYIQANPGDHYSSIRHTLRLKNGTLAYHLRTLERENFVFSRMDGIYRRFYPSGADPARVRMKGNLKETHRRMLELIEAGPGITPKELAVKLGTSHQVASYHIRLLARRGRIRLEQKGRNTLCFPCTSAAGGSER